MYVTSTSDKHKLTALLLCIFGGFLGLHYFYVCRVGMGILYLCTLGFFGIGWLIDILKILLGGFRDNVGAPLRRQGDKAHRKVGFSFKIVLDFMTRHDIIRKEVNCMDARKIDLCIRYGISVSTIDRLMKKGLPYLKIGKSVRFDIDEVGKWLKESGNHG